MPKYTQTKNELRDHLCEQLQFIMASATGEMTIQSTYPKLSKPIIDRIDRVLAQHYGFTDGEIDFIINYDIKYRLGGAEEDD